MKKMVYFMNSMFANQPKSLNTNNKINYWCPTGMIPVNFDYKGENEQN